MLSWDDFDKEEKQETPPPTKDSPSETLSHDTASEERFVIDGYTHEDMVQIQDNILQSMKPVRAEDKRMIGGTSDINQLVPFGHPWAWEKYLNACANHWMPTEINMNSDIAQWKSDSVLTEDERRVIKHCLGFFSTADTIVGNNCVLSIYPYLTSPEARQFIQRQTFEEAMHCYIDGTEILTEYGFVDFRDLQEGVKVAQYHEDGGISFVVPSEIIRGKYDGEMVAFQGSNYCSIVTPNHRCVAINTLSAERRIEIHQADSFYPANYQIPTSGFLKRSDGSQAQFTDIDRFRIAFQADGYIANSHTKNMGAVTGKQCVVFQLKKQRKIDRLLGILNGIGVEYTLTPILTGKNSGHVIVRAWVPIAIELDKDFSWVKLSEIDGRWCSDFIHELAYWDGCWRPKLSACYTNTNRKAVDTVVAVAHLGNMRTGIRNVTVGENRSQCWQVHIYKKHTAAGKGIDRKVIQHSGEIHCVTVPTGMVVVRYGDCVTVSGNSHSYQYCIESMGLNQEEIFSLYHHSPAMRAKAAWCLARTKEIQNLEEKKNTVEGDQAFLEMLIAFYVVMEGIFFYCGFPAILSMGRRGKMSGVAEQFQYILRDECVTEDTEVLTPDGWIKVTQVTYETELVQWEPCLGLSFVNPEALSKSDVDYTYEFIDQEGKLHKRVSANHRIPYFTNNSLKIHTCIAEEFIPSEDINLVAYTAEDESDPNSFRRETVSGKTIVKNRIDEPTTVYGIQVPSSYILIRYNGVVSITGNSNHLNFGIDVINQIKIENPHLWTKEFQKRASDLIYQGTMLEINFARDLLPRGVLGMNAPLMEEYLKFIANRRLGQLGLPALFEGVSNPFPWMSEMIDLTKEKNFFETRVTDYQVGGTLSW